MRYARVVALFSVVIMAACSGGPATTASTAPAVTTTTSGSATTAPSVVSTTSSTSTSTTTTTTTPLSTAQAQATRSGLGDPYYPDLGNGGYDALHYTLDLTVDVAANSLEGDATMEARALDVLEEFNLDFIGFEITSLTVDGIPVEFDRSDGELTVVLPETLDRGEEFRVEVGYQGTPRAWRSEALPMFPMGWLWSPDQVTVVAEPDAARTWYPVNDHPLDKATYSLEVTVPEPYVVAANGIGGPVESSGGMLTYRFEPRDPMASYLVTVNIGRFEVVEEEGPGGLPMRSYVPADLAALPAGFSRTADMIDYYSDVFGPYPFETYGVVIVDRFEAALENQTLSVFGRYLATFADAEIVAAHELAHQWFGDSLTPALWEDIWLNEGFATYAEWLWLEHTAGDAVARAQIRGAWGEMQRGRWAPPGDPDPNDLFDSSVYLGGGLVLHALRQEIGDEAFFATLRTYVARFSYSNVTTADFIAVAEEVSGRPLDDLFDLWLHSPTVPDLPA